MYGYHIRRMKKFVGDQENEQKQKQPHDFQNHIFMPPDSLSERNFVNFSIEAEKIFYVQSKIILIYQLNKFLEIAQYLTWKIYNKILSDQFFHSSSNLIIYQTLYIKMLLFIFTTFIVFCTLFQQSAGYLSQPPQWLTSEYFRAGNQDVISTLTGEDQTPTFTYTFSSPLPDIPNLAYGVKNYIGNDYIGSQLFQIRREELTSSTFTVSIQIFKVTNIWKLNVPYIAIDPDFPHHLNSFDNVPVNYSAGNLVNITSKSTQEVLIYTNTINYTQQAQNKNYKSFNLPLSNIKVILYICAVDLYATKDRDDVWYPVNFHIAYEVLSPQTYSLTVHLSNKTKIEKLHFSEIILDLQDVQSSNKYAIVAQNINIPQKGQFIPLPEQFVDNFIMGLLDFSTLRGKSVINFNWDFKTQDGVFGIKVQESVPRPELFQYALTRMGTVVFYIKTWRCLTGYNYFNTSTDECQDVCGDYHYENMTVYECQQCNNSCQDCTSPDDCLKCNEEVDHRFLSNGTSCQCMENYYDVPSSHVCLHCSTKVFNCIDCFYNSSYNEVDSKLGAKQFGCYSCEEGYYRDGVQCVQCSPQCKSCTGPSSSECSSCFYDQNKILIGTQCLCDPINYLLPVTGQTCIKIDATLCDRGYERINQTEGECNQICGDGILIQKQCDDGNRENGDGCSDQCIVQEYFNCSDQLYLPSICYLDTSLLTIIDGTVLRDYSINCIEFILSIQPYTDVFNEIVAQKVFTLVHEDITIVNTSYLEGKVYVLTSYQVESLHPQNQIYIDGHSVRRLFGSLTKKQINSIGENEKVEGWLLEAICGLILSVLLGILGVRAYNTLTYGEGRQKKVLFFPKYQINEIFQNTVNEQEQPLDH